MVTSANVLAFAFAAAPAKVATHHPDTPFTIASVPVFNPGYTPSPLSSPPF